MDNWNQRADAVQQALADTLAATPCGCPSCDDGVQQGHFACEPSPDWALKAEAEGRIARDLIDNKWCWFYV